MVHLYRAMKRVDLPLVTSGISQDMGDDPPLILACDGRVAAVSEGNSILFFAQISLAKCGYTSHSAKKVGRRCVVGTPDQSKIRSETQ
jgi:hypothetical protein